MIASTLRNELVAASKAATDSCLPPSFLSCALTDPFEAARPGGSIGFPTLELLSEAIDAELPLLDLPRDSALLKVLSPSCVSIIVVVYLRNDGSGGSLTRVKTPGTFSEKCRETKVDTKLDLPTPSANKWRQRVLGILECSGSVNNKFDHYEPALPAKVQDRTISRTQTWASAQVNIQTP